MQVGLGRSREKPRESRQCMFSISYLCFFAYLLKSSLCLLTGDVLLSSHDGIQSEFACLLVQPQGETSLPLNVNGDSWRRECDPVQVRCPPLVRPGGQGYKVSAGDQISECVHVFNELSTPCKKYPLHVSRSVVRTIALLDYCPNLSQKIMGRRVDKMWLNRVLSL